MIPMTQMRGRFWLSSTPAARWWPSTPAHSSSVAVESIASPNNSRPRSGGDRRMTARNLPPALDAPATLFHGGVIWTPDRTTDAVLVADGVVRAVGAEALAATADRTVD